MADVFQLFHDCHYREFHPACLHEDHYLTIAVAVLAGILIDIFYAVLKQSVTHVLQLRLFAALVAGGFYLVYILVLQFTYCLVRTIHLAGGVVTISALVRLIPTYLLVPVTLEEETTE